MFKKLGELFRAFAIARDLRIEQQLQSAEAWDKITAQNRKDFVDWLGINWKPATDAERKQKAEALDKINNNTNWISGVVEEFKEGYNSGYEEPDDIDKSEVEETTDTTAVDSTDTTAEDLINEQIEQGLADKQPTTQPTTGGQTLDTSTYKKFQELGILGNEAATNAYIVDAQKNGIEIPAEELAFLMAAAGDAPLRPKTDGETTYLVPFTGHFVGVPLSDIIDNYASQGPGGEIEQLQLYLEQNGIVGQNYFAQSRGEPSEELREVIRRVMKWIDFNIYAVEGTGLYDEIINEMTGSPVFFTKNQELNGDFNFARQLFNFGLKEMAENAQIYEAYQEAEYAKEIGTQFIPPTQAKLEDMVEGYFEDKLNRPPTAEELDLWSTKFAESYSMSFREARAKAEAYNSYNFLLQQPEIGAMGQLSNDAQALVPGKGSVDLSQFTYREAEDIRDEMFEDEFGRGIDAAEEAVDKQTLQHAMFRHLLGRRG